MKALWEIISSVLLIGILVFGGISLFNPKKADEIEDKIEKSFYEAVEPASNASSPSSSYAMLAKSETFDYAKIEWGNPVVGVDYNLLFALYWSAGGELLYPEQINQYDKKALWDAQRYVRSHETNLINNGAYYITLYKHYYSENDNDGWVVMLTYHRREDDFTFDIFRISDVDVRLEVQKRYANSLMD